jgi:hypothetical protein
MSGGNRLVHVCSCLLSFIGISGCSAVLYLRCSRHVDVGAGACRLGVVLVRSAMSFPAGPLTLVLVFASSLAVMWG